MILAVAKNRLWNLRRDRAAMVLSFAVPLVFFTVFAAIFARGSGRSATNPVRFGDFWFCSVECERRWVFYGHRGMT